MEAQVAAHEPAAGTVRQPRPHQDLGRIQRSGCDDDSACVHPHERAVPVDVLDASRLTGLDHDALDPRVGAELEPTRSPGIVDVGVERGLARIRRAALQARPTAHAVRVGVGHDRLERRPELAERRLDRVHALTPVAALAHAEPPLDRLVVRIEVGCAERSAPGADDAGRLVPLRVILVRRAQRDLRVDCCRASDATSAEQRYGAPGAAVDQCESHRPPEIVGCLRLPTSEVGGSQVRPELEQEHAAPLVGELAGHHPATRARADDDDVEALASPDPQVGPVLRQTRGER